VKEELKDKHIHTFMIINTFTYIYINMFVIDWGDLEEAGGEKNDRVNNIKTHTASVYEDDKMRHAESC
jgi:hypothetical protein